MNTSPGSNELQRLVDLALQGFRINLSMERASRRARERRPDGLLEIRLEASVPPSLVTDDQGFRLIGRREHLLMVPDPELILVGVSHDLTVLLDQLDQKLPQHGYRPSRPVEHYPEADTE